MPGDNPWEYGDVPSANIDSKNEEPADARIPCPIVFVRDPERDSQIEIIRGLVMA